MTEKERQAKEDELFDKAARFVIKQGHVRVVELQREFHLGYARAYGLIQRLEFKGIVSNLAHGTLSRKISMTIDQYEELPKNNK